MKSLENTWQKGICVMMTVVTLNPPQTDEGLFVHFQDKPKNTLAFPFEQFSETFAEIPVACTGKKHTAHD